MRDTFRALSEAVAWPCRMIAVTGGGFFLFMNLIGGFSESYGPGGPEKWGPYLVGFLTVWGLSELVYAMTRSERYVA